MKDIDFITLDYDNQDILEGPYSMEYPYSLEAYDGNKPCGGCRVKNKDDLKEMYVRWKESYGMFNLKYIFKKGDKVITL